MLCHLEQVVPQTCHKYVSSSLVQDRFFPYIVLFISHIVPLDPMISKGFYPKMCYLPLQFDLHLTQTKR